MAGRKPRPDLLDELMPAPAAEAVAERRVADLSSVVSVLRASMKACAAINREASA